MNISSEIFPTDEATFSDDLFYNGTGEEIGDSVSAVLNIIIILLGFPLNTYVVWLVVTGEGNGLKAELFSLNLSVCEILFCLEFVLFFVHSPFQILQSVLYFLEGLAFIGRLLFQCLMCVERYLAVVHPVTFLKYRPLRYRLICCVIDWVASFIYGGISILIWNCLPFYVTLLLILAQFPVFFSIQLFCLVAVLKALKQSGPGVRKREKEENHMKRRAFYIILITTVILFILIFSSMISFIPRFFVINVPINVCFYISVITGWLQPVLFLYRVGKLSFNACR